MKKKIRRLLQKLGICLHDWKYGEYNTNGILIRGIKDRVCNLCGQIDHDYIYDGWTMIRKGGNIREIELP